MFHGEFNDFLSDCSKNPIYRQLLDSFPRLKAPKPGKPDKNRMFDVELILRFFALYDLYDSERNTYPDSKGETLNDYMRKQIKGEEGLSKKDELESLFNKSLKMVQISFYGNQFKSFTIKKDKAYFSNLINAAIFDVQMLGFVNYSLDEIQDKGEIIYEAFLDLCYYDRNFIDAISRSTNSKVNERILIWTNKLKAIIENPQPYLESIFHKKKLFDQSPFCKSSGKRIESFEEADFYDGNIYHRAFSPKLDMVVNITIPRTRSTNNTTVKCIVDDQELEFDNMIETLMFVIDRIADNISDDPHEIVRLSELDFIGTQDELLKSSSVKIHLKPFANMQNMEGKKLYISVAANRTENIENIKKIASLFSFMNAFKILD